MQARAAVRPILLIIACLGLATVLSSVLISDPARGEPPDALLDYESEVTDYECVRRQDLNVSIPRHNATMEAYKALSAAIKHDARCGCLRLEDPFPKNASCPGRRPLVKECARAEWKWIVLIGDSTVRQYIENIVGALQAAGFPHTLVENGENAGDKRRKAKDLILPSLKLLISYRLSIGLSSSMLLDLLYRPFDHIDYMFPANFSCEYKPCGLEHVPVTDLPRFTRSKWTLDQYLPKSVIQSYKLCGPDFVMLSSGLWETWAFVGQYEKLQCGMPSFRTVKFLWQRRLRTAFGAACNLYGKSRFVWRNSPAGLSESSYENGSVTPYFDIANPYYDKTARPIVARFGLPYFDYHGMFAASGYITNDGRHPAPHIVLRAVLSLLSHFQSQLERPSQSLNELSDVLRTFYAKELAALKGNLTLTVMEMGTPMKKYRHQIYSGPSWWATLKVPIWALPELMNGTPPALNQAESQAEASRWIKYFS